MLNLKHKHRSNTRQRQQRNVQPNEAHVQPLSLVEQHTAVLSFQRDQLQKTLSDLESQLDVLTRLDADLEEKLREEDMAVQRNSIHIDESISGTMSAISDLLNDLECSPSDDTPLAGFFFQCSTALATFFDADFLYGTELGNLTKAMFSQTGDPVRAYGESKDELERLSNLYPVTEKQYANAMAEVEAARAGLAVVEEARDKSFNGLLIEPSILKSQIATHKSDIAQQADLTADLRAHEFIASLNDFVDIEIRMPVLELDYLAWEQNLKQRADKTDKIISHLILHHAYQQFVQHVIMLELEKHQHVRYLICAIGEAWRNKAIEVEARIEHMSTSYFTDHRERKTVDVQDEYLMSVKRLLNVTRVTDGSSTSTNTTTISELFTTTGSLIDQIEVLVRRKKNAEKRVSKDIEVGLKTMDDSLMAESTLTRALYKDSPQDELAMMPKQFTDLQSRIEQHTNALNGKMRDITEDAIMTRETELRRRLFWLFWQNPHEFLMEIEK